MDEKTMKVRMESSVTVLADGELVHVSGARRLLCVPLKKPHHFPKTVSQTNTIGDVSLDASGNSGSVSVTITQTNTVE
jgi:hypothetical protein